MFSPHHVFDRVSLEMDRLLLARSDLRLGDVYHVAANLGGSAHKHVKNHLFLVISRLVELCLQWLFDGAYLNRIRSDVLYESADQQQMDRQLLGLPLWAGRLSNRSGSLEKP